MHPRPSVHLELPALPAPAAAPDGVAGDWWRAVGVAGSAGAQGVWLSGGPVDGSGEWCDPVVLAAAAVPLAPRSVLGVVSVVPAGRHPAVLARDLTALDVVSKGRAAVLVCYAAGDAGEPAAVGTEPRSTSQLVTEAAAVCRAVLSDENPVFEGRYFHVAGAVNRPRPVRAGGPPLLAQVPPGWAELVGADVTHRELGGRLVSAASAVVCAGGPAALVACREALDGLQARPTPKLAGSDGGLQRLWWRGPVRASRSPELADAFEESRVDGLILQLPPPALGGSGGDEMAPAVEEALTWAGRVAC